MINQSFFLLPSHRFEWSSIPNLIFCPCIGHLHAGQKLPISVQFTSDSKVCLNPENVALKAQEISYSGALVEWNDTLEGTDGGEDLQEPEHDVVAGSFFERNLKVN